MDCTLFWPPSASGAAWGHWISLAEKLGAKFPLERAYVIGVRGIALYARESHPTRSKPGYDDTMIVIPKSTVHRNPPVLACATHAYQTHSKASPDVNRDGVGDVATIKPGSFRMHLLVGKYPSFEITLPDGTRSLPSFRDTNHDGTADDGNYTADQILFHVGHPAPADSTHKSSIGCQTAPLEALRLLADESLLSGGVLDYRLITVEEALPLVPPRLLPPDLA